jgi:hypothetical protein
MKTTTTGTLPNFVIVGAMRSGTTSLTHYLRSHPDVFMSTPKEPHFFDRNYHRGFDFYSASFAGFAGEKAIGEATQTYLYDERAIAHMAKMIPDARLVAILRNPVDRAYSHYWQNRSLDKENLEWAEAIDAEPGRLASNDPLTHHTFSYVDRGIYVRGLKRVSESFPRESLHLMLFEEMRDEPVAAFAALCRFLGVEQAFTPPDLGRTVNPYVSFRSLGARRIAKRMPRALQRAVGRMNVRPASYPPMDTHLRAHLLERFQEPNRELAEWWGRDLSIWSS